MIKMEEMLKKMRICIVLLRKGNEKMHEYKNLLHSLKDCGYNDENIIQVNTKKRKARITLQNKIVSFQEKYTTSISTTRDEIFFCILESNEILFLQNEEKFKREILKCFNSENSENLNFQNSLIIPQIMERKSLHCINPHYIIGHCNSILKHLQHSTHLDFLFDDGISLEHEIPSVYIPNGNISPTIATHQDKNIFAENCSSWDFDSTGQLYESKTKNFPIFIHFCGPKSDEYNYFVTMIFPTMPERNKSQFKKIVFQILILVLFLTLAIYIGSFLLSWKSLLTLQTLRSIQSTGILTQLGNCINIIK